MSDALPPSPLGAAGLTGRPQIVRVPDDYEQADEFDAEGNPVWGAPRAAGKAIPPNCLRVLNSPLPVDRGGGCNTDCPGRQQDGGCLADVVRSAIKQGVDWSFEVDPRDNSWHYNGPTFDAEPVGARVERPTAEAPTLHTYDCPHCGLGVTQQAGNWWCPFCGKNAHGPVEVPEIEASDPHELLEEAIPAAVAPQVGGALFADLSGWVPDELLSDPGAAEAILARFGVVWRLSWPGRKGRWEVL